MDRKPFNKLMKKGLKNRPIVSLGTVLPQVSQNLNLDQKVREMSVLALWSQVAPPSLVGKTQAFRLRLKNGCYLLQVRVVDSTTASELSFHTDEILQRLNGFTPQTGFMIAGLEFRMGPL